MSGLITLGNNHLAAASVLTKYKESPDEIVSKCSKELVSSYKMLHGLQELNLKRLEENLNKPIPTGSRARELAEITS